MGGLLAAIVLSSCAGAAPLDVVEDYARAVYARDYAPAYDTLSAADRAALSKEAFVAQYENYDGARLDLARRLAALIEFQNPQVIESGDSATVTAHVRAPDGNAAAVAQILHDAGQPRADVAQLRAEFDDLVQSGQLPFIEVDQTFELRRDAGRWAVYLSYDKAAQINFTADVKAGLPWEFEPLQPSARLLPGDAVRAEFRIRNISDQKVSAKAKVQTLPLELSDRLYFYQCFCLLQTTLDPGEEQIMSVVVGLVEPLDAGQNELEVHYDFYPLDAFPEG
jgi:hypothetical protein